MIFTPQVMNCFCELVGKRLEKADKSRPLTEDEVQDSYNYSLVSRGIVEEHEIRMEYGFPGLAGKLDSYVDSSAKHGPAAWEVKYDRKAPEGRPQPSSAKLPCCLEISSDWLACLNPGKLNDSSFTSQTPKCLDFSEISSDSFLSPRAMTCPPKSVPV